jgi:hypothetical protein
MANGWPEGSYGEAMNNPSTDNSGSFKPISIKDTGPKQVSEMADRTVSHVQAATPSERRGGARFYDRARRDAYHVSKGVDPGLAGSAADKNAAGRPGRTRNFNAVMDERGQTEGMKERQPGITRAAHQIAQLSPSLPAGMSWHENPRAAHQVSHLTGETLGKLDEATRAHETAQTAAGLAVSTKNAVRKKTGSKAGAKAAGKAAETAHGDYRVKNDAARAQPDINDTELKHAGSDNIVKAHDISTGAAAGVASRVKTGAFAETIARPRHIGGGIEASERSTIDGRSHDIAVGKHLGWKTDRGLGAAGRYQHFEEGNRQAAARLGMYPHQAQAVSWIQDDNAQKAKASEGNRNIGRGAARHGEAIDVTGGKAAPA